MFRGERKCWSTIEEEWLIKEYKNKTMEELCYWLARDADIIRRRMRILGLIKGKGPVPVKPIKIVCPVCEDTFEAPAYELDRGHAKYCSAECMSEANKVNVPSKEEIELDYNNKLSTNDISQKYNISKGTVYNLFQKYQIESRTLSESINTLYETPKGQEVINKACETKIRRYGTLCLGGNGNYKIGMREDLGISVRSSWEANFLRLLNSTDPEVHQIAKKLGIFFKLPQAWQYEPIAFEYTTIKRGTRWYTPDVFLPNINIWIELKGYLRAKDKTKIKRFNKYYPKEFEKLYTIIASPRVKAYDFFNVMGIPVLAYYNELNNKLKDKIDGWE
jgi:hypothetical protein